MRRKIGVFDSGIGGLTVLEQLRKVLPQEDFIYFGDSKNNPYGEKSDEQLYCIVKGVVDFLIKEDVKLIVIACNTATTKCMKRLRIDYPGMIFVGIVPAIKVACDRGYKNVLVMATPVTISSFRTNELIKDNKREDQKITLLSCDGLAHLIEEGRGIEINTKLEEIFAGYKNTEIDAIVLGCTHYPLIKDNIIKVFGDVVLLDGSLGVAKEVKRQLENHNLLNDGVGSVKILNSLKDEVV